MKNLRILSVKIIDSTSINAVFTDSLTTSLTTDNVSIKSDTINVPDSKVLKVHVKNSELNIICQPLTNLASYFIEFQSTSKVQFSSVNGTSVLLEDGVANKYFILGPIEPENIVKSNLENYLKDNIYNINDDATIVSKYVRSISQNLSKALYDIRQVKNENYLSIDIIDEKKSRGKGPFDRLSEESAYEVIRVGRTKTGTLASKTFSITDFTFSPISLQKESAIESLTVESVDSLGVFNVNSLILNLSNNPVIKLNSLIFTLNTSSPIYTYDIETLGYQLLDSKYDKDFGFSYDTLSNNQIRLNEKILSDPLFSINKILKIDVEYEFKNTGIVVDDASLNVFTTSKSIREVLPPIINVFNLKHAPIVDGNSSVATLSAVTFTDPNSNSGALHPAFASEIIFRLNALPSVPGQYSIDYLTGTVYVYGEDLKNDGTGPFPPLATYNYIFTFKEEQDYVYDSDLRDLVALSIGNLLNNDASISFNYEQVLIPDVDYVANIHKESLNERIQNKLLALNTLRTQNLPITNVFQVYNETSGEIYTIDRWNNDKIYFRYHNPPRVLSKNIERATFNNILNELLFVNTYLTNSSSLRIFNILLKNNNVISSSEDAISSSINTSLFFSKSNVFSKEKWFDARLSSSTNIDKLKNIGEYCVDYINGIIYCAVSSTQDNDIGTASYKNNQINPQFPHIISVDDIYYQINILGIKDKKFSYDSFDDGEIIPETLNESDESYLNSGAEPYQILTNTVGTFIDSEFITGVTSQVKYIRGLFEFNDLTNSTNPMNFASYATSSGYNIDISPIIKNTFETVGFDHDGYYVYVNENIPYSSSNITYNFTVTKVSNSAQLWDSNGYFINGNPIKLILSGVNNPAVGDLVNVVYTFTINSLSRVIVDYNKGDLFIDYTYLADEIIVSYEYGDNSLDFRTNTNLPANTQYFVSYRIGALRDALLNNFGNLINISELSNFDLNFNRERYRDAVSAAMTSFIQGPTLTAIKNICKTISHVDPVIIESAFRNWSLGSSLLAPESIKTAGSFQLLPAKYSNGVLIDSTQTISFPVSSNLRLEEGTFETWISPQWNGLDNDSDLTFTITDDGYNIDPTKVFVGASEYHPEISSDGKFSLNKNTSSTGTPNINKDGVFIYYDKDISGNFNRWFIRIIDGYAGSNSEYKFKISSSGSFYDSKRINVPKHSSIKLLTGLNSINFTLSEIDGYDIDEGITFISDIDHYILDFGDDKTSNRFSLFKDISGYLVFRVYDKNKTVYSISADVSAWKFGDLHHVSISWKLNNRDDRDEMHLFIDGQEVPNIIKYGQKLKAYLHEKFRTVDPEEILGLSSRDIVSSIDLTTIINSAVVTSSLNFSSYNIFAGDTIFIDESGFSDTGYTIVSINGQTLSLNQVMPATISDGRFSINRTQFTVSSDIDVASNTVITTLSPIISGNDVSITLGSNIIISSNTNFTNAGILPGYLIRIDDSNLELSYNIVQVVGHSIIIEDDLPISLSNASYQIYSTSEVEISGVRAVRPSYSFSKDSNFNNILTISNDVKKNDLILIRTLGLNHRKINQRYYVWSDNIENILMTRLPAPISLDEVKVIKVILPTTSISKSNSTLVAGIFQSNNLITCQPSNSQNGRTLSVTIGGNNVDFSTPVSVTINGISGIFTVNETIDFTDYGTLDFADLYLSINYIQINVRPINSSKSALNMEVKEKYSITHSESSGLIPIVRYSYNIGSGYDLYNDGYGSVRDGNNLFSGLDIGNYLLIHTPAPVAGFYIITGLSDDRRSLKIKSTSTSTALPLPSFTGGIYQILNTNEYRSGLQNGFFTFESTNMPSIPYLLSHGFYELEYQAYTKIPITNRNSKLFLGSDFNGENQINGIIDQVKIYSNMLTDTRIGESIPDNQRSITKDFNSLKPLKKDSSTLMLIDFDSFPFFNSADFYRTTNDVKKHFQSSSVVNENFVNSLVFLDTPLVVSNDGILDTKKEGTIEFWMSPLFDTSNDPNDRFYFDAFGAVVEESVSNTRTSVKLSSPASQILSVKLKNGDKNIDYFAGGKIETDTINAIQEESVSISNNVVTVSKPILQVIKIQIIGDVTESDYFADGSVGEDQKTIYLGKLLPSLSLPVLVTYQTTENKNIKLNSQVIRLNRKLPYVNSKVIINYVPKGLSGDRLSIYKDKFGYINFAISASGTDYIVRAPTHWAKNTWHRVKASYKINSGLNSDEMRLFLDGYQYTDVVFSDSIVVGKFPIIMGSVNVGPGDGYSLKANIIFKDQINDLYIGSQFSMESPVFALLDNFRISNLSRPIYAPYGEPIDVNYNSNIDMAFPVTEDLYTTYLLDFNNTVYLNDDFSQLKNRSTGSFDFSLNILDSFDIVNNSAKVKETLEKLIKVLKPANSKSFISYTR